MDNSQTNYVPKVYGGLTNTVKPYVYRITNIATGMHYYGKRLVNIVPPHLDIGSFYYSSSSVEEFLTDQKNNPQNYKYKVVRVFDDIKSAGTFETFLLKKFNAVSHEKFYNKNNGGHDTTGVAPAFTDQGYIGLISCDDPRWETGEIFGSSIGTACAITVDGTSLGRIPCDDPRWETGEILSASSGKAAAFLPDGTNLGAISTNDPRWATGEIVGSCAGTASAWLPDGTSLGRISCDDPRWETGEIKSPSIGKAPAFLPDGTNLGAISTNDPRWATGEIVGGTIGFAAAFLPDGTRLGAVSTDDPRWETGEIVGVGTNIVFITDGKTSRFYRADGTDSIPDGWSIDSGKTRLRKGVRFLNALNVQTGEKFANILSRQFCKVRKLSPTDFLACANKNRNMVGDTVSTTQGWIVNFTEIQFT